MRTIQVRRPDWIKHSTPQKAIDLYNTRALPGSIAGWMIVVGLKHPLRAVYGSDIRAALALLVWAIWDKFEDVYWMIRFRIAPPKDELSELGEYEDRA